MLGNNLGTKTLRRDLGANRRQAGSNGAISSLELLPGGPLTVNDWHPGGKGERLGINNLLICCFAAVAPPVDCAKLQAAIYDFALYKYE